jgi:hypothetical protein
MFSHCTNGIVLTLCAGALVLASGASATVIDFEGVPAGATFGPSAKATPGASIPGVSLDCFNAKGSPHALIAFDSTNPTGGDADLGTPNVAFGGSGRGFAGASGEGVNDVAYGNVLIIAENVDDLDFDGLVDVPDDEAMGGIATFRFDAPVVVNRVVLLDIDTGESAQVRLYLKEALVATFDAQSLGNNSIQTLDASMVPRVDGMEIELSSSGAIAEIEFTDSVTPTENVSWGQVKSSFGD